jgi:hypothetical protein
MTLIKLTETHYIDSNELSSVEFRTDSAEPTLDILCKSYSRITLSGSEALEAWDNIRNAVAGKAQPTPSD